MNEFNSKILKIQIVAVIIASILGIILHFLYQISNENKIVALFSAVNESTWEHLKITFFPIVIVGIIEYFFVKNFANNYIEAKTLAAILSTLIVTVLFYTYTGIFGKDYFIADIIIFFLAIIFSEFVAYKMMILNNFSTEYTKIASIIAIILVSTLFGLFTFNTPKLEYFKDPISKNFGIK